MLAASTFSARITLCRTASLSSNFVLRLRRQRTALTALAVSAVTRACHASHINTSEDVTGRDLSLILLPTRRLPPPKLESLLELLPPSHRMEALRLRKKFPEVSQDEIFDLINKFKCVQKDITAGL